MLYKERKKFCEGRTKVLFESGEQDLLIQHFKDGTNSGLSDISSHNINAKGVINNRISSFLMTRLNFLNIRTHFIRSINMREQLVKKLDIIPIEICIRNLATENVVRRVGLTEGEVLPSPVVEFYYNKPNSDEDWLVAEEHVMIFEWLNAWEIEEIKRISLRVNDVLSGIFAAFSIRVVDFSIKYGREYIDSEEENRLLIADELSADTCTLWGVNLDNSFDKTIFDCEGPNSENAYMSLVRRMRLLN